MKYLHNLKSDQRGNTPLILIVAVALIAVVGIVGYRALNADTPVGVSSTKSNSTTVPNSINNLGDVKQASNALDSTVIDGSVNPNQLDENINELL